MVAQAAWWLASQAHRAVWPTSGSGPEHPLVTDVVRDLRTGRTILGKQVLSRMVLKPVAARGMGAGPGILCGACRENNSSLVEGLEVCFACDNNRVSPIKLSCTRTQVHVPRYDEYMYCSTYAILPVLGAPTPSSTC